MLNLAKFLIFSFSLIVLSCSKDDPSTLTVPVIPPLVITNGIIKYSTDVSSIINSNCITCHANTPTNGAPMSLTTYDDVKNAILTRGLLDRISRTQGVVGMMPNGGTRLPQATIDKIVKWQTDGFVN